MNINTCHNFFVNLSNPLKMNLVLSLEEKDKNVNELVRNLRLEQSKISHALASLKCCNIVSVKQEGKQRIYSLNKKTIIPILKIIQEHSNNFCNDECELKIT